MVTEEGAYVEEITWIIYAEETEHFTKQRIT
jgi:hypothetical protein